MCSSRRLRDLALLARLHLDEPVFQVADARVDEPAIFFQLRFAGAARADAAADAAQVGPHLRKPRQGVFQLGQLDLQARLDGAARVAKMSRISSLRSSTLSLVAFSRLRICGRRQVVVEDDHVGVGGRDLLLQFFELALADVAGGVDLQPPLAEAADDGGAGGGRQAAQLVERVVADPGAVRQVHADEEGFFEMDGQFVAVVIESHGLFYFLLGGARYVMGATLLL